MKLNKTAILRVLEAEDERPKLVRTMSAKFHPIPESVKVPDLEDELKALGEVENQPDEVDVTAEGMDALELDDEEDMLADLPMAPDGTLDITALLQQANSTPAPQPMSPMSTIQATDMPLTAYKNDFEYLADQFQRMAVILQLATVTLRLEMKKEDVSDQFGRRWREAGPSETARKRELEAKLRAVDGRIQSRMSQTLAGEWLPRLESLTKSLGLTLFDKQVIILLIGTNISGTSSSYTAL